MTRIVAVMALVMGVLAAAGGPASAGETGIVVNGVEVPLSDLAALKGKTFKGCEVSVDDQGRLHLAVPGLQLKVREQPSARVTQAGSPQFYLVSKVEGAQATGFHLALYIGDTLVRTVVADRDQVVEPLASHLAPGKNALRFTATKMGAASGRSTDRYTLMVALGYHDGNRFTLVEEGPSITVDGSQEADREVRGAIEVRK